jgi:hypothetical protein
MKTLKTFKDFLEEANKIKWSYDSDEESTVNRAVVKGHAVTTSIQDHGTHHEELFELMMIIMIVV